MLVKLSYLAFYLRLMPDRRNRIIIFGTMAVVTMLGVSYTFVSIFMCTPIEKGWEPTVPGTCVNNAAYLISNTAFNMLADVVIFILPMRALWSLRRER